MFISFRFSFKGRLSLSSSFCFCVILTGVLLQFGHFLSVNLAEVRPTSTFTETFRQQLDTLEKIEEEEGLDSSVHDQVRKALIQLICHVQCADRSSSKRSGELRKGIWCLGRTMHQIMLCRVPTSDPLCSRSSNSDV